MTKAERVQFERDGLLVVPAVLAEDEVAVARDAILRATATAGRRGPAGAGRRLPTVTTVPELAFLLDHPKAFRYIWSLLGWNVHLCHSRVDVRSPLRERQAQGWHLNQVGDWKGTERESRPPAPMSVNLAYWMSEVPATGPADFTLLPGRPTTRLPGRWAPGTPWPGPLRITMNPGDLAVFDRRLWPAQWVNHSPNIQVGAFFSYSYRWITALDDVAGLPNTTLWERLTPVQRQLLGDAGDGTGDHAKGHCPETTALYGELKRHGVADLETPRR